MASNNAMEKCKQHWIARNSSERSENERANNNKKHEQFMPKQYRPLPQRAQAPTTMLFTRKNAHTCISNRVRIEDFSAILIQSWILHNTHARTQASVAQSHSGTSLLLVRRAHTCRVTRHCLRITSRMCVCVCVCCVRSERIERGPLICCFRHRTSHHRHFSTSNV